MKFLLNMNMPRELGRRLATEGHEWRHVREIAMARASDAEILAEARKHQDVVVTHDLDYGHLLAFSGEPEPSPLSSASARSSCGERVDSKLRQISKPAVSCLFGDIHLDRFATCACAFRSDVDTE